jgi:hypothetical protein
MKLLLASPSDHSTGFPVAAVMSFLSHPRRCEYSDRNEPSCHFTPGAWLHGWRRLF